MLEKASLIWQKLMLKASLDLEMIKKIMMNHVESESIIASLLPFYFDDQVIDELIQIREH